MKHFTLSLTLLGAATLAAHADFTVRFDHSADLPAQIVVTRMALSEFNAKAKSYTYDTIATSGPAIRFADDAARLITVNPVNDDTNSVRIVALPNENVTLTLLGHDMAEASVSGSPFMQSVADFNRALRRYSADSLARIADSGKRTMEFYRFKQDYILSHRNDDISVWILNMPVAMCAQVIDSISPEVRSGLLAPMYTRAAENVADYRRTLIAREAIAPGNMAPSFTLPDISGRMVSLESLRGRWVLLDFWATWCVWCIKGFPEMRQFSQEHSAQCAVVTIDCRESREVWADYVSSHSMPWINLWIDPSADTNPMQSYAVESLPTKVLIDPEGKIRLVVNGHTDNFFLEVKSLITSSSL